MEYYGIHYDSVIEHHGIKGQKWGVRRTKEQLGYKVWKTGAKRYTLQTKKESAGSRRTSLSARIEEIKKKAADSGVELTPAQLSRINRLQTKIGNLDVKTAKYDRKDTKLAKKQEKYQKKIERAEQKEAIRRGPTKSIDEVIKNGDYDEILSRRSEMTEQQLGEAFRRLNTTKQIQDLSAKTRTKGEQFLDSAARMGENIKKAYDTYQTIAKVTDALGLTDNLASRKFGGSNDVSDKVTRLINNASATEVYKKRGSLTAAQMAEAQKRIQAEEAIKKAAETEKKKKKP